MAKDLNSLSRQELLEELQKLQSRFGTEELALVKHDLEVHREELHVQNQELQQTLERLEASRDAYAELYDFAPVGYVTLNDAGIVQTINLTLCALLGVERGRLLGMPLISQVVEEGRAAFFDHLRRCRASKAPVNTELALRQSPAGKLPVMLTTRVYGEDYRTIISDLSQAKAAEQEIRALNEALEQRVQQRTAELEKANRQLQFEIEQRREAESQLRQAHRRKDEFLAMLGHELRNPLGPIRNCGELLRIMARKRTADLKDIPEIILRQTGHLARIVDDLLDLGRIASGKFLLQSETLDLCALVKAIVSDVTPQAASREIELKVVLPDEPLLLVADPTRLSQAIGNLLHNSMKFSDRQGHIEVRVGQDRDKHEAVVTVKDDGIGIDDEMLSRLFEPFTQAERTLDRSRGGLGLGLALVKGLVELHEGRIEAKSRGLGHGAEFIVRLPLEAAPLRRAATPADSSAPRSRRVLVIDDQPDTRQTMHMLLRSLGHDVVTAKDGEEGLRVAREHKPDVIFSDIGMPGIDGYGVARTVRKDPQTKATYLVAITGYGQSEDQQRAYDAGFDCHMTKPIPLRALEGIMASLPE